MFLQPFLEILSSYLIHTTHFARADSRAVLSLLPCRYPRIGSFTTLKSWISKSDLGTTEEIALLPTLRESSSDQDYASDEASNDDIHSPLRQVRLQERFAGKMPQVASGRQAAARQAVLQSCNSLPAHISAYQPPCHPSLSLTLFLQLFSNWLHPGSHHRCPRLCGRWSGGTGWVWLRRQHGRLFVHNKTMISLHLETLHKTTYIQRKASIWQNICS